jgi:hypothetical protein
MTHQGLRNLFDHSLTIEKQAVLGSSLPIWSLTWYLRSWVEGLQGATREEFLQTKVGELIGEAPDYLERAFVSELNEGKLRTGCLHSDLGAKAHVTWIG